LEPHLRTATNTGTADVLAAPRRRHAARRSSDRPSSATCIAAALIAAFAAAAVTGAQHGPTLVTLALAAGATCVAVLAWPPTGDAWEPRPAWRGRVIVPTTAVAWAGTLAAAVDGRAESVTPALAVWWIAATALALLLEPLVRAAFPPPMERALILGTGMTAETVARKLRRHPEYRIEAVGPWPVAASPTDPVAFDRIVVAAGEAEIGESQELIERVRHTGVRLDIVAQPVAAYGIGDVTRVEELALLRVPAAHLSTAGRAAKRAIDIAGAVVALIVTAPLVAAIAIAIKRDSPGPVFFRQTRLGEGMREFTNLKFRTMRTDAPQDVHRGYIQSSMTTDVSPEANGLYKLERGTDITRVGRWLRRTSLDELPQFWNVLRGDISLVGPRPCIPYEVEFFEPRHYDRFMVPAGITGLWQVTARARSTFGEALDIDVAYVHSRSLRRDLGILLRTPVQLLRLRSTA
jgi:lipopolysaccharide/colanic/teichoic acid biosynthesis glycosyltransferase